MTPNTGEDRGITYRLYGGDRAVRLEQEMYSASAACARSPRWA